MSPTSDEPQLFDAPPRRIPAPRRKLRFVVSDGAWWTAHQPGRSPDTVAHRAVNVPIRDSQPVGPGATPTKCGLARWLTRIPAGREVIPCAECEKSDR